MKSIRPAAILLSALALGARPAAAHHVTDFLLSQDPTGASDALVCEYEYDTTVAPLAYSFSVGAQSVFSGTNPGFDAADGDEFFAGVPYHIYPPGVSIWIELVDNDGGRTAMKLRGKTLAQPGDTVELGVAGSQPPGNLHHHPEWLLFVDGPPAEYAEGRIAFRVTSPTPGYGPSRAYTLRLTTGHLPPPDFGADAYDKRSVACQQAVGRAVEPYVRAVYGGLRRCLDKLTVARAKLVAGEDVTAATGAAAKTCTPAAQKAEKLRARAAAAIGKRCDPNGSGDFTADQIAQHLAMARCRAEEIAAASYFRAQTYLTPLTAQGRSLREVFPCVFRTAGEEEGRS